MVLPAELTCSNEEISWAEKSEMISRQHTVTRERANRVRTRGMHGMRDPSSFSVKNVWSAISL